MKIPIHFNKLWVNDVSKSLDSCLEFKSDENNLTIDFSAIYYQRRDRIAIYYKLISGGDTIIKFITDNKINLLALRDGNYQFQLYAYDQDYPYIHSEVKSLKFSIQPPFYKTWWFWVAIFSVIGSVVAYLYYRKMLRAKNRQIELAENQSKLNEYSLKSLQNQMNPHFIFNSLNTLQHLMTSNQDEEALNYLSDFSQLMREMLANSRLDTIHLSDEINFLNKYIELEKVRFSNEFDLEWQININEDELEEIIIPAMLIQPIVENAIKHGAFIEKNKRGKIEIFVNLLSNNMMQFVITNSKQNIVSTTSRGNDTALKVINERLKIYQKNNQKGEFKLEIQDHLAMATINIPI